MFRTVYYTTSHTDSHLQACDTLHTPSSDLSFASAWRYSVEWTPIHVHMYTAVRRTTRQTSDSSHAGHMPFLQRAQWQTPVRFTAVPDVDNSLFFLLTPNTVELIVRLRSFKVSVSFWISVHAAWSVSWSASWKLQSSAFDPNVLHTLA